MPQPLPTDVTGAPIPWEKVPEALASGQAGYAADEDVHVMNPSTKEWRVTKGEKVGQYLHAGWTLASPAAVEARSKEEAAAAERRRMNTPVEALKAAAEGYGRGLTGGLSDVAGAAISPEWAENARKRREAHGFPSAVGELQGLGGALVGSALLAPEGVPEEAATAASRIGSLGRALTLGGRAVTGAGDVAAGALGRLGVEGASIYGRAGLAAARGMGEGAVLGLGQGLSEAALENRPLASQKVLASIGHGMLLGGLAGGVLQPAAEAVTAGGRRALEAMTGGRSMEEALGDEAARLQWKGIAGNNIRAENEVTYFGADPERKIRVGKKLLALDLATDTKKAVRQIEDATEAAGRRLDELATARESMVEQTHNLPGGAAITGGMDSQAARSALEMAEDQANRIESVPLGSHKAVAAALRSEIAPLKEMVAEGAPVSFRQLWGVRKKMYDSINWARQSKAPQYMEMRELARNFDDALTMDMDAVGGTPGMTPIGEAWRAAKEDYHDLATARDAAREEVKRQSKNRAFSLTDYLLGGAVFGAGGLPGGIAAAYGNKLLRERGPAAMAKLLSRLSKVDMKMSTASKALLEQTPKLARAGIVAEGIHAFHDNPTKEFEVRRDHLMAAADPQKQTELLAPVMTGLQGHADMQHDISDLFQRANAYLLAHLPTPLSRSNTSLTPDLEKARVPRADMLQWLETARTLDDPVGTIAIDLAKGRVSRVKLDALKAIYPDLYKEWGNKVAFMVAERAHAGHPLPYRRRVFLSLAFGFNGDASLDPARLEQIQQAHAVIQQTMAQQGGAPPGPPEGGQSQMAQDFATEQMKFH